MIFKIFLKFSNSLNNWESMQNHFCVPKFMKTFNGFLNYLKVGKTQKRLLKNASNKIKKMIAKVLDKDLDILCFQSNNVKNFIAMR